jgi:hypothetical protein
MKELERQARLRCRQSIVCLRGVGRICADRAGPVPRSTSVSLVQRDSPLASGLCRQCQTQKHGHTDTSQANTIRLHGELVFVMIVGKTWKRQFDFVRDRLPAVKEQDSYADFAVNRSTSASTSRFRFGITSSGPHYPLLRNSEEVSKPVRTLVASNAEKTQEFNSDGSACLCSRPL